MLSVIKFIAVVFMIGFFPSYLNAINFSKEEIGSNKVFIIIQKSLSTHLDKTVFQNWVEQLKQEGWTPIIRKPELCEISSASKLKEYLAEQGAYTQSEPFPGRLNGVILIGDFPYTYVDLNPNARGLSSDIWLMRISNKLSLVADRIAPWDQIMVKSGESLELLDLWVSRIETYTQSIEGVEESGASINQYLKKNTYCRSSGFTSDDCQLKAQVSSKKFWGSKALIGVTGSVGAFDEKKIRPNKIAGEAFGGLFAEAQKNWKQWQDYFFDEGWEHCNSFLGDMYHTYNRTHSQIATAAAPGGVPPIDKGILYVIELPVLFLTAFFSAIYGWRFPPSRKYLGATWTLLLAASLVPQYKCPNRQYTPKRHYLPVLLGDGTLRKSD